MEELISPSSMIIGVCKIIHVKVYLFSFKTQRKEVGEGVLKQPIGPRGKAGNKKRRARSKDTLEGPTEPALQAVKKLKLTQSQLNKVQSSSAVGSKG